MSKLVEERRLVSRVDFDFLSFEGLDGMDLDLGRVRVGCGVVSGLWRSFWERLIRWFRAFWCEMWEWVRVASVFRRVWMKVRHLDI